MMGRAYAYSLRGRRVDFAHISSSCIIIMRTIIDLPDHQVAALAELCEREQISRAEAVRRALDAMLVEKKAETRESAFGSWASRGDSRAEVDGLREEWSR